MDTFDLGRLTDHDFELVCKDLFEETLSKPLEVFTQGQDGGVDLRHISADTEDDTVIQCKHWHKSGIKKLIGHYKASEADKVKALAPNRYIIATSASTTPTNKRELIKLLSPHLRTPGDILGVDEIVALLRSNPNIVKRHLRLWLSSTAILESLLARTIQQRASFLREDIQETLRTYAPNAGFDEAIATIDAHNILVISGTPGVGKTTLAHVVAATHQAEGFETYEVANDIDDVLQVWDDERSQLFYYDDFLGQTSLRDTVSTSEDSRLLQLIKRVSKSPNKRLILTTREYILAQARRESEQIDRSEQLLLSKFVIEVSKYTLQAKAGILYNHLYYSALPKSHMAIFADPKVYYPIITHRNFNPRLIAMTFDSASRSNSTPQGSVDELMNHLDDPALLWSHMFDNQMSSNEVNLVLILFTFDRPVNVDYLIDSVASRNSADISSARQSVRRALKSLEGTMVRISLRSAPGSDHVAQLHNPSIRDFLKRHLAEDHLLLGDLIQNMRSFDQVAHLFTIANSADGGALLLALLRRQEDVERKFYETIDAEIADLDTNSWFYALSIAVQLGLALGSPRIIETCKSVLSGDWPDYSEDPSSAIALVRALESADQDARLRAYAVEVSEWLAFDLLQGAEDWDTLQSASDYLSILGGKAAEDALSKVEDRKTDHAIYMLEQASKGGHSPSLTESREMIEHLGIFSNPEELVDGFNSLRDSINEQVEEMWADQRSDHLYEREQENDSASSIESMMVHLRD